VVDRNNFLYD